MFHISLESAKVTLINDCNDFSRRENVQFRQIKFFLANMGRQRSDGNLPIWGVFNFCTNVPGELILTNIPVKMSEEI